MADEDGGGRRHFQSARPQVLSGCTGQSQQPKPAAWAAQNNTSKKCSVTCRRQLSHLSNLPGREGSLTSLAAAMASHEELYRSQVRPIAVRETRRRVRPKSYWCSPRELCSRSPQACNKEEELALWHGLAASHVARESKGQWHYATRPHLPTHTNIVAPTSEVEGKAGIRKTFSSTSYKG
jgi:hypothetical protein